MAAPQKSLLDANQCIQGAYDENAGAFRIETTPETGGMTEVSIDAADDSVRVGDGSGNFLAINSDGSINVEATFSTTGALSTVEEGLNSFQTSQYTIGTSPVQITPTPLTNRSSISLTILATPNVPVYIGNSSSVTISTGYPLYNGNTIELDLTTNGNIWAISTVAGQTVAALEIA